MNFKDSSGIAEEFSLINETSKFNPGITSTVKKKHKSSKHKSAKHTDIAFEQEGYESIVSHTSSHGAKKKKSKHTDKISGLDFDSQQSHVESKYTPDVEGSSKSKKKKNKKRERESDSQLEENGEKSYFEAATHSKKKKKKKDKKRREESPELNSNFEKQGTSNRGKRREERNNHVSDEESTTNTETSQQTGLLKPFELEGVVKTNYKNSLFLRNLNQACFLVKLPLSIDPHSLIGTDLFLKSKKKLKINDQKYVSRHKECEDEVIVSTGSNNVCLNINGVINITPKSSLETDDRSIQIQETIHDLTTIDTTKQNIYIPQDTGNSSKTTDQFNISKNVQDKLKVAKCTYDEQKKKRKKKNKHKHESVNEGTFDKNAIFEYLGDSANQETNNQHRSKKNKSKKRKLDQTSVNEDDIVFLSKIQNYDSSSRRNQEQRDLSDNDDLSSFLSQSQRHEIDSISHVKKKKIHKHESVNDDMTSFLSQTMRFYEDSDQANEDTNPKKKKKKKTKE